ncbi:sugar transporter [Gloeophyllum trabeum ATCC 11539]|uniref:Sugar transporter n=1 Tax=Gloeophyllum trabeum (strain ATCC 11539 / FP-39264 / Madison 617) TaxID=670483 RepID=S7PZ70_GLOTA|nr:sugar transporter [Gloeophyllum trabeum ATCC 11539]EPQ52582.1 sugar transporter [Gloeophyllum trabeum ATCC 11539]
MGSVFYGWDIGLIGGILSLPSFQAYFGLHNISSSAKANLQGNIVAVLQAGCFFGALFTGYFSGVFGRKPVLLASGVVYIVGSIIQTICGLGMSQTVALRLLYFGRFLGGVGVGMESALVPSYVSESVPRTIRGRCTAMIQFANNVGIMLSFWVNYGSSLNVPYGDMQWRMPFAVQVVPGALFIVLMLFQPESPRWLVEHGKYDRAARSLAFAAGKAIDDPAVQATLAEIQADFAGKPRDSVWKQFRMMGESWTTALRCFIPSLVMFFQQWTGTNAINYYSPEIFAALGISGTTSGLLATGVYGIVKVIAVGLVCTFAVEGMGRKRCLIYGGLGQGVMMLWIGGFQGVHPGNDVVPASYVSIVAVYLYAVFYCVGWGPVPWVVAGEVAPNHVRTAALAVAVAVNWLFAFTIGKITPIMLNSIKYGTFLLFGMLCLIMAAWAYFLLPETTGYALEDIKYLFEKDLVLRSVQDAPGGKVFLGRRRALSVQESRVQATESESKKDGDVSSEDGSSAKDEKEPVVAEVV